MLGRWFDGLIAAHRGCLCSIPSGDRPISGLSPPPSSTRAAGLIPYVRATFSPAHPERAETPPLPRGDGIPTPYALS